MEKDRFTVCVRTVSCAFLLILLGVCGYSGSKQTAVRTTGASLERTQYETPMPEVQSAETTDERLRIQRREQMSMLEGIISNPASDTQTVQAALAQKAQIVGAMETESLAAAAVAMMGYDGVSVLYGEQALCIFVPEQIPQEDQIRIFDAVSTQTGLDASNIKMILIKK